MEDLVYIPIPHYPPFKLRSSLIDKDPVIWVHLLEGYIQLCQVLLSGEIQLNVKSVQQLQLFVKVYLYETSEEATKIFSLGTINPDIKNNTAILRAYVFQLIKDFSVVKLALNGESLWNFVLIYVSKNASTVRNLIMGSHKSPLNDNKKSGKISLIPVLRKYLLEQMALGSLSKENLRSFADLLGLHTSAASQTFLVTGAGTVARKGKVLAKDKYKSGGSSNALLLAENFVNEEWIEGLELLYAGGKSIHAATIKNWMVVSILSLSTAKVANVITKIGIKSAQTLSLAPLVSAMILSDAYKKLNPGLEEKLPFLRNLTFETHGPPVEEKDIDFLVEMFPSLTKGKATTVLLNNDNDVEKVTHILLEDPDFIDSIPEYEDKRTHSAIASTTEVSTRDLELGVQRFKLNERETNERIKKEKNLSSSDTKNKTLTAALRLLYESDEDERDDTYDDQEQTSGLAFQEFDRKPKFKDKAKLRVFDDDLNEEAQAVREDSPAASIPSEYERIELYLFGFVKNDELFEKTSRKSKLRADMRKSTGWSDEQIEGWFRMLKKSPKRYRMLEEQYVFHNSNRRRNTDNDYVQKSEVSSMSDRSKVESHQLGASTKKSNARKEQNKASRANHNRKSGHNKKTVSVLSGMQG